MSEHLLFHMLHTHIYCINYKTIFILFYNKQTISNVEDKTCFVLFIYIILGNRLFGFTDLHRSSLSK